MKSSNLPLVLALAVSTLIGNITTQASIVSLGDPYPTQSWAWNFDNPEPLAYTHVEGIMVSGTTFENPGFTSFTPNAWISSYNTPNHIAADGPATTDLTLTVNFNGDAGPTIWDLNVYAGSTAKASYRLFYQTTGGDYDAGGGWRFDILDENFAPAPVPEPTTVIAGALLLLPFGASTIRILRKNHQT